MTGGPAHPVRMCLGQHPRPSVIRSRGDDAMAEQQTHDVVTARPSRSRSVAAAVCIVLAALLTVPAAVAFWGQRTLNDGAALRRDGGPAGRLTGGAGGHRDQGHRGDPAAGRRRGDPQPGLRGRHHRPAASAGPGGTDRGRGQRPDRDPGPRVRRLRRLRRLLGRREHPGAGGAWSGSWRGTTRGPSHCRATRSSWTCPRSSSRSSSASSRAGSRSSRTGPDPRQGPADRADGRAAAEPGAHDLRVRQPGRQVADRGGGAALPRRASCSHAAGRG